MRSQRISFVRYPDGWRWTWHAGNGKVIGASTQGYGRRKDAIANLETLSGGKVTITYRSGRYYAQGQLARFRYVLGEQWPKVERIHVEFHW